MTSQRTAPADAYPTRRSLREAERRAARRKTPALQTGSASVHTPQAPTSVSDAAVMAPPRSTRRRSEASKRTGAIPRVAILGTLAAATTVVPLNGLPASIANTHEVRAVPESDVLDVLMGAASDREPNAEADILSADDHVGARAAAVASRSMERTPPSCSQQAGSANGVAAAASAIAAPTLVMPMGHGTYRVTSQYGYRTLWGRGGMHHGVDFAAPQGTPIHSIADGVVEYTGPGKHGRSSMLIIVRHNINGQIVRSWYVHMYSNGVYVRSGQQVKAGQVIGGVGNNGFSTGPHLHFEIHLDDNLTTTDPAVWLARNGAATLDRETRECLAN